MAFIQALISFWNQRLVFAHCASMNSNSQAETFQTKLFDTSFASPEAKARSYTGVRTAQLQIGNCWTMNADSQLTTKRFYNAPWSFGHSKMW
jgi:hypothetical protein